MTSRADYRHHYTAAFTELVRRGSLTVSEAHAQACTAAELATTCEDQMFGSHEAELEALRAERDKALEDFRENEKSLMEYERVHGDGIDALEALVWSSFPALKAVRPSEFADDPEHYEALLAALGEVAEMSHEADEAARQLCAAAEQNAEKLDHATEALERAALEYAGHEQAFVRISKLLWPATPNHMEVIEDSGLAVALDLAADRIETLLVSRDVATQVEREKRHAEELAQLRAELAEAKGLATQIDAELAQVRAESALLRAEVHAHEDEQHLTAAFLRDPTTLSAVP
jgi:DNA repair exonuclease SbcCD ATPase subunit